jgi:hypothetical protein
LLQLDAYRANVLHSKLIELACSDGAIAVGIARRSFNKSMNNDPDFGLAAALLNVLDSPTPWAGLTANSARITANSKTTEINQAETTQCCRLSLMENYLS